MMDRLLELTHQAEARHFWFRGFRRMVQPLVRRAAAGRSGLRILDCGCGTGHNLRWLARYGQVIGLDYTASGLRVAKGAGRPLVRGDAMSLPFPDATFDVVTAFDSPQCIEDDVAAFREIARVLKPGGALVAHMAAWEALSGSHGDFRGEYRRYTPALARQRMAAAHLDVRALRFGFAVLLPVMLVTRWVQQRLGRHLVEGEAEIAVPVAPVNAVLSGLLAAEAAVSQALPMPFGSSLRLLARKPR